ncbi:hypothetical protein INT48_005553 [Thamnidium elegans]|uniref:BLOC-1-related complex subunit 5 n=1 Tax=Thamnidium elegans TaxID=101142 RepID=A0A8H7VZV3_9FUNG|nr:hypothetical protein INT48_005553 [Thamnidium elegans]
MSSHFGTKHIPSLTPSSSSTSYKNTIPNKVLVHPPPLSEEDLESSGISEEEGIIQVVIGPEDKEEEEELKLLRSIKRFEPFIKEQDKGFQLEHLLGLKQSKLLTVKENNVSIPPSVELFFDLQAHIRENMIRLNNEQRILLRRIVYVDELSSTSAQIVSTAFNQAKIASERFSEVTLLKEQATKTQAFAINIFKSLTALEKYLDPEDRIEASDKWPELKELRNRASKSTPTPFDRITKPTTTNDLTIVGSSTLPLLERVIINGEPAFASSRNEDTIEVDTENDPNAASTSTSSLALSRLKSISSRSLQHTAQDT